MGKEKIEKSGPNHSITVPRVMIDSKQIDPAKRYTVTLIEEKEIEEQQPA